MLSTQGKQNMGFFWCKIDSFQSNNLSAISINQLGVEIWQRLLTSQEIKSNNKATGLNIYDGCRRTKLQKHLRLTGPRCSVWVERIAFPVTNVQIISPLHREVLFRTTQCTPIAAESACHQMLISFHCKCCEIPLASADLHQIYRGVRLASGLAPLVNEY